MKLYHFTCHEHLSSIMKDGLTRGEVPLTERLTKNGVWFTTDSDPAGHGLSDGEMISPEDAARMERLTGQRIPMPAYFPNKRAVRITVVIPSRDRSLVHWPKFGRKHLARDWYDTLNQAGGNKHKSWYIYFGTIKSADFKSVEILQPARELTPV